MPLQTDNYAYQACEVTTILGNTTSIPAGVHPTTERQSHGGGKTILVMPRTIDIGLAEWARLQTEGLVRKVP